MKFELMNSYDLKEVLSELNGSAINEYSYRFGNSLVSLCVSAFGWTNNTIDSSWKNFVFFEVNMASYKLNSIAENLLNALYVRFKNSFCVFTNSEFNKESKAFLFSIMIKLNMNFNYYKTIISYYESAQNDLLNQINTTSNSLVRFNDTPQEEGDFANDEHTTSINQSETSTSTDLNSPIMRLKEIQDHYKRTLEDWLNEFKIFFREDIAL